MSPFFPSASNPFGPLTSLHTYILAHAEPLTLTNWPWLYTAPCIPLGIQTYLMQFEGTRSWRMALGVVGLLIIAHAWMSYRFDAPWFNALNNGNGIAFLHLGAKFVEFALLERPIIDPYRAKGRSLLISTLDLAINSRMVGLGPIGLDATTANPKKDGATASAIGGDGGVQVDGKVTTREQERWLPYRNRGRTRLQACLRHAIHSYYHFVVFDTLLNLIRYFGPDTIGNPTPGPNALPNFIATKNLVLLPRLYPLPGPAWFVEVVCEFCLAIAVWQGIEWGYHFFALLAVGTGLWETESWEVDMFDAPWKADSMMDLWGRRWHQVFRHHFLVLSTLILRLLRQPPHSPLLLPLIFIFSGFLHALGQLSMDPVPSTLRLTAFFVLSGFGVSFEAAFRRITGRRVRGWTGRIWTWTFMLIAARLSVRPWFEAGVGGSYLTPSSGPGRLSVPISRWIVRYVVDEK